MLTGKAEPFRTGERQSRAEIANEMLGSLILFLRRVRAFLARDWWLTISYRMQFFLRVLSILIVVTTLFFVSKIFVGLTDPRFAQWRDPLAAWLTGLAVLNYFMTGFSSLANAIRSEQMQGTLESVLLTPISVPTVIVASSAWDFVQATLFSFLYLFFGWLLFDVHYRGSYLLALVFLVLTTMVLACLGILSASFAMVFKRGDPFGIFLGTGSALFSGVFFPTQLISQYAGEGISTISRLLPATYGLDGIRRVLIQGEGLSQVHEPLLTLIGFLVVLLPFSLWVFGRAVRRAKREGSLIQY
jgi:ABC-2 type transport system permease protein